MLSGYYKKSLTQVVEKIRCATTQPVQFWTMTQ